MAMSNVPAKYCPAREMVVGSLLIASAHSMDCMTASHHADYSAPALYRYLYRRSSIAVALASAVEAARGARSSELTSLLIARTSSLP